ncbi:MAG: hypothetical protein OEY67_09150, partial [Gammaproteobacteria bacterium]|nr:hypothetical protein [Gammaproteobacteria bacterium]
WEKWPRTGFQSAVLEQAAPDADVVIFCLPVNPHRQVARLIAPLLAKQCICVSIAKGLDEAGQTAAQIFADIFSGHQPYALLYGPMISEEIRANRYAFAQVGCTDNHVYGVVSQLFAGTRLCLERSEDIDGITWSVILKNVYAMLFGIADELSLGDNMRGYLMVACLNELEQIVMRMGGSQGSPYQLAGLGDLVTTATSEDSHHHALGRKLARGEAEGIAGEGVHTLQMVTKHKIFPERDFPLFYLIHEIINSPESVSSKIEKYLNRLC